MIKCRKLLGGAADSEVSENDLIRLGKVLLGGRGATTFARGSDPFGVEPEPEGGGDASGGVSEAALGRGGRRSSVAIFAVRDTGAESSKHQENVQWTNYLYADQSCKTNLCCLQNT